MRFSTALIAAATASLASAQAFFTMNVLPSSIAPGTNYDITWLNGQGTSTVSIQLVQGTEQALTTVQMLASGQSHNGTYTWSPSASLTSGTNYAFKIVDDSNPNNFNYSGMFSILTSLTGSNTMTVASTSGSATASATNSAATTAASSSRASGSAAAATGSSSGSAVSRTATGTTSAARTATSSAAQSSITGNVNGNGAATVKVGGGVLAAVAAFMMLL